MSQGSRVMFSSTQDEMSPAERLKVLVFFALFFGASGFLLTLLSCGTEYWLLASESCGEGGGGGLGDGGKKPVRIFHEGLFWRCSFLAASHEYSVWDLWIVKQPLSKLCQAAFLFPFPVKGTLWVEPHDAPYEHSSAIGVAAVVIGGFVVICAAPLTNHRLYKVGGALQLCGGVCLLAVLLMYVVWIQVLDTLEQFVLHQRASGCPSFHLGIQHGPSFLLAPAAVFFCLLAGLLSVLVGCSVQRRELDRDSIDHPVDDQ
ncbi:transmembrane protein 182-like isoform X2 [Parambassis ranga]|uniref:Transmembrane protein 182 n=1 Tax=Parambassis ranga TaxID=210632 RepID=A0A6P7HMZ4_9TELE|nr:transmembrane protein 182-like isoform X2 [Parambassis ranga]